MVEGYCYHKPGKVYAIMNLLLIDNFIVKSERILQKTMKSWKCPECGFINRDDIALCECGYDSNRPFLTKSQSSSRSDADLRNTMIEEQIENRRSGFLYNWGAIFYIPVIGLIVGVIHVVLALFRNNKTDKRFNLQLFGGLLSNILYLLLLYKGVRHRIDFEDSLDQTHEKIRYIRNFGDYGKAMLSYMLNRPFFYGELAVMLVLRVLHNSRGGLYGGLLGLFVWIVIGDFCYVEFEYETLHIWYELGILGAALTYLISSPIFVITGAILGAIKKRKEICST